MLTALALTSTLVCAALAQDDTLSTMRVTFDRPDYARYVNPTLAGLSIELDRFPDWAGNISHPNEYTYALLNNLKQRTGAAVTVRVGGGTQDRTVITPSVEVYDDVFPAVPANYTSTKQLFPEANYVAVGKEFYLTSGNFPSGTQFIWGVDLMKNNVSEAKAQVQAIKDAFKDSRLSHVQLQSLEFGNEPDSWANNGRPANWTLLQYADQYASWVDQISSELNEHSIKFQIGSFAAYWRAVELFSSGVLSTALGKRANSMSEHHYQNLNLVQSLTPSNLINKAGVRGNLSQYTASADASHASGLRFYLGETNTGFSHGVAGVSNANAAALWLIDYALQAGTLGIDELHFHQGVGYNYSAFVPIDNLGSLNITDNDPSAKRHILPSYNGFVVVADAIGTSGKTWMSELYTDNVNLAAYSVYEDRTLKRIVLINSVPWLQAPVIKVDIPQIAGKNARLKRLSVPSLDGLSGISWGGQNWETYNGTVNGTEQYENVPADGSVTMEASSAVLIYL